MILSDTLRAALTHYDRRVLDRPRRAGVLVGLIEDDRAPRLLLTRRAETLGSHQGEVAFPGGMLEAQDESIVHTALREAHEEVNLPPSSVEVLGVLDDMMPKSEHVAVTPVVGVIRDLPPLRPNPSEVARIFEIPLDELLERDRWRVEEKSWRGEVWPLYFFETQGETLWGLSAYIALLTLSLSPTGSPVDLSWYHEQNRSSSPSGGRP
jgi:8-oxo-dGTP pyrophosphatase MutT (NUDIX family)